MRVTSILLLAVITLDAGSDSVSGKAHHSLNAVEANHHGRRFKTDEVTDDEERAFDLTKMIFHVESTKSKMTDYQAVKLQGEGPVEELAAAIIKKNVNLDKLWSYFKLDDARNRFVGYNNVPTTDYYVWNLVKEAYAGK